MNDLTADKLAIRETVENWVIWRDAGDWDRFATVWHSDGWMTATWFQGPAKQFIEASRSFQQRRQHLALARRVDVRGRRSARHLAGQDDDQPACAVGRCAG